MLSSAVVALGGGHGLAATLSALRRVVTDLTAVVTVADNGGSSGRLREEFDCLPPGDLRQALSALCGDDDWGSTWAKVLQHRFQSTGEMNRHSLGNLLIVAIWELLGDHVGGLDLVGRLLQAEGRGLPMGTVPLVITAGVVGAYLERPSERSEVRGQFQVATTRGRVVGVTLEPSEPPACPEAVQAVGQADWVLLGPGWWFTSVIPHLLVPDLRTALESSRSRKVVVLNMEAQHGETEGSAPETHLEVLADHSPGLRLDWVLAESSSVPDEPALRRTAEAMGAQLEMADLALAGAGPRHDPVK